MNGKFEEKLARLAFGDLSPDEAARVEAEVSQNPKALRALAEYREMQGGLRSLAEVPEHQLSNERLRNAILTQGLRTKPEVQRTKGLGAGWIWMPVTACALGFALITMRNKPAGEPQILIGNTGGSSLANNLDFNHGFEMNPKATSARLAMNEPSKKPETAVKVVRKTSTDEVDPRSLPKSMRANPFTPDNKILKPHWGPVQPEENSLTRVADNRADGKGPILSANNDSTPLAMSSPLVLIDSNPDSETGAPAATEVGTASNILIGG